MHREFDPSGGGRRPTFETSLKGRPRQSRGRSAVTLSGGFRVLPRPDQPVDSEFWLVRTGAKVEVAGIEPASFDASTGLLRAQPAIRSRAPRSPPASARSPSRLNVPAGLSTRPAGKPYLMTPVPDPQGWGRTDGLLVRQPVRAEARRLFIGSGSLTWFRRPRLASPELTAEVEANHPHVGRQLGQQPGSTLRVLSRSNPLMVPDPAGPPAPGLPDRLAAPPPRCDRGPPPG